MPKVLDKIMGYKPSGYNRKRLCLPLWKGEDAYVIIVGLLYYEWTTRFLFMYPRLATYFTKSNDTPILSNHIAEK